jgi:hypothetical protein
MRANRAAAERANVLYYGRCTSNEGRNLQDDFRQDFELFLLDNQHSTMLVIDEDLCHNRNNLAYDIIDYCNKQCAAYVFCYIREVASYYISFYCYASLYLARTDRVPRFHSLSDYITKQLAYKSAIGLLDLLANRIGHKQITVTPYSKYSFINSVLKDDFLTRIRLNSIVGEVKDIEKANISPNIRQAECIYYALRLTSNQVIRSSTVLFVLSCYGQNRHSTHAISKEIELIYQHYGLLQDHVIKNYFHEAKQISALNFDKAELLKKAIPKNIAYSISIQDQSQIRDFIIINQLEELSRKISLASIHLGETKRSPMKVFEIPYERTKREVKKFISAFAATHLFQWSKPIPSRMGDGSSSSL